MRKAHIITIAAIFAALLVSCSPQAFTMHVDIRRPSASGLDLAGKSMAVVYMADGKSDSFCQKMAESFAQEMEKEYFSGKEEISLYQMSDRGGKYSSIDTLRNLVMDSGKDVVFLFDTPAFGKIDLSQKATDLIDGEPAVIANVPFRLSLYAYDSMAADTVLMYQGHTTVKAPVPEPKADASYDVFEELDAVAENTGKRSSQNFHITWTPLEFDLFYYDGPSLWDKASQAAYEYRWQDAINDWLSLLNVGNAQRRSAAEYNIAVACHLLGDSALALKWLDRSDADYRWSISSDLRSLIKAK